MPVTVLSVGYPLAPVAENTAGGAEQILAILDQGLIEAGEDSIVIAPEGSLCRGTLLAATLPAAPLDDQAHARACRQYRAAIRSALKQYPVDVVHLHGIDFLEYLPKSAVPVVVTLHLPLSWYPAETFCLARPDTYLICVSESQRAEGPPDAKACRVIPNGVRLDEYRPARVKRDYAVALGRVCPEKGFHVALDAASEAGIPLVLAGQVFGYQTHAQYFETMIQPRLKGNHRFIGAVGGHEKNELLARARCLVIPSLVAETSSLVAMEALASGTPVVAFPSGALPTLIEEGTTGFVVRNVKEMAHAILRCDQLDPDACRRTARLRFSAEKMEQRYLERYAAIAH